MKVMKCNEGYKDALNKGGVVVVVVVVVVVIV